MYRGRGGDMSPCGGGLCEVGVATGHWVAASPLSMAEGSISPMSECALAGSSMRLSRSDIRLSDFCSVELELVSVLRTTLLLEVEEVVVVVEDCCWAASCCCFLFISYAILEASMSC